MQPCWEAKRGNPPTSKRDERTHLPFWQAMESEPASWISTNEPIPAILAGGEVSQGEGTGLMAA